MMRLVLRLLLAVVSPVVVWCPPVAHAQPASLDKAKTRQAKSYVDVGLAAQTGGDFDTAIMFYTKAYELVPHPVLLFDIAQAHRLAGRADQAAELYQRFLATEPSGPEAEIARDMLAKISRRRAEPPRGAARARKSEPVSRTGEAPNPDPLTPDVERAHAARVPRPSPTLATGEPGASWSLKRKIAVATAAGGVLTLAVGTVLGMSANSLQRDARAQCTDPPLVCADADRANDLIRSAHDRAIMADVVLGVGAGAVIAAGVLWFTGGQELQRRVAVLPAVSPGLVVVTIRGEF